MFFSKKDNNLERNEKPAVGISHYSSLGKKLLFSWETNACKVNQQQCLTAPKVKAEEIFFCF
ncbi:hypothetical protein JOC75_001429 [Metabacillus crassostreae]|uniref:hypothetical protein n=1 Tax=Metabacillus crassostreae TaxID=929098 RepID=UPI001958D9FA|nr:hypothetical protein [Metabacillus crassostreae]MBM7603459.1 hypothetical protein [Metabacillus crassostreae]